MSQSKFLQVSDVLQFPRDFITETCAIIAQRRAGKTYTEAVIIEEMVAQQLPFVALDPTGASWGLRASADGKGEGLPVVIIGGAHADVPLEVGGGALIADLVVDHPGYYILDLSGGLEEDEQHQIALDFARRLFVRKQKVRAPLHIFVDEADEFAKQTPMSKLDHALLRAYDRLCRRGGIFGIGMTFITQRPQVFNKDLLSQIGTLIVLRMVSPQDQDAIEGWVKRGVPKNLRDEMMNSLSSLRKGEAWVLSPGYLEKFVRVQIRERRTFNSSATPTVGEQVLIPQRLAAVDLAEIGEQMRETIQRAQQNDPTYLREEIARLRRELAVRPVQVQESEPRVEIQVVEKPVLNGQLPRLEAALDRMTSDFVIPLTQGISGLIEPIATELRSIHDAIERVQNAPVSQPRPMDFAKYARMTPAQIERDPDFNAITKTLHPTPSRIAEYSATAKPATASRAKVTIVDDAEVTPYMRDLLKTFARRHPLPLTKSQLALLSKKGKKSSALDSALAKIKRLGLVTSGSEMNLTESGFSALGADVPMPPQTFSDIVSLWREVLNEYERALFDALLRAPHGLTLDELSERSSKSKTSSQFQSTVAMFIKNKIATRRGERIALHNPLS